MSRSKEKTASNGVAPTPFDLSSWVTQNGGIHLSKESELGGPNCKLVSHVVIDKAKRIYTTIHTYRYLDGTYSLGKMNPGGNVYPLKGKTITVYPRGLDGAEVKKQLKGRRTAKEVAGLFKMKGYK